MSVEVVVGIIIAVVGWTTAVIKYLIDRMDDKYTELHDKISKSVAQNDFDRHVDHMERQLTALRDEMRKVTESFSLAMERMDGRLSRRLDALISAISGKNYKDD